MRFVKVWNCGEYSAHQRDAAPIDWKTSCMNRAATKRQRNGQTDRSWHLNSVRKRLLLILWFKKWRERAYKYTVASPESDRERERDSHNATRRSDRPAISTCKRYFGLTILLNWYGEPVFRYFLIRQSIGSRHHLVTKSIFCHQMPGKCIWRWAISKWFRSSK